MIKKKNIVHITEKFWPHKGGSTHRLLNLLKFCDTDGFNVVVLCENSENSSKKDSIEGIKIIRFDSYWEIPFLLFKVQKNIGIIDIFHAHNFRPSLFALMFKKLFSKRSIFINELHAIYKVSNRIKQYIGNYITKSADIVIVLSETSKKYLIHDIGILPQKIKVIYNGIDTELFANKTSQKILPESLKRCLAKPLKTIAYIGSLHSFQGIDNFIKIAKEVIPKREDVQFLLVGGDNDEIGMLRLKVQEMERIYFYESVEAKYIPTIYQNIDVLLVPRPSMLSTETAIPLKPLEAMAAGKLVVGTNVGGMKELESITKSSQLILFDTIAKISEFLLKNKTLEVKSKEGTLREFEVKRQARKLMEVYW